jgi:hypothetical protein
LTATALTFRFGVGQEPEVPRNRTCIAAPERGGPVKGFRAREGFSENATIAGP